MNQVEQRVRDLMGIVFRRDVSEIEHVDRENISEWDSFKHVELIFAIEDEFDVSFSQDILGRLHNIDDICAAIESHRS